MNTDETAPTIEEPTTETPQLSFFRTALNGAFEVYEGAWGSYLRPCSDPEYNATITKENLEHFELKPGIHKIPATLWTPWVNLCFYYVDKVPSQVEVSVRFLRNIENPSEYRAVVPKQDVSMASVRAENFDNCVDLVTGEEFTHYPPEGWIPIGSSHSHNTMSAFFSGTDDKYELDDPGIHLVIGKINTNTRRYEIATSVVGSRRRFRTMQYDDIIDATPLDGVTFHPNVLKYVSYQPRQTYGGYNYSAGKYQDYKKTQRDPFKRQLPPAGNKEFSSLQEYWDSRYKEWGWGEHYDDYDDSDISGIQRDPFYWNDGHTIDINPEAPDTLTTTAPDIYQITDLLNDFLEKNHNDHDLLSEMKEELASILIGIELELAK
jgi:hypothetical protein